MIVFVTLRARVLVSSASSSPLSPLECSLLVLCEDGACVTRHSSLSVRSLKLKSLA